MPSFFSRLKGKDGTKTKSKHDAITNVGEQIEQKPRWADAWSRTSVETDEVQELISRCTEELKARGLDLPFFLLPFRPTSDPSAVRIFIRHFFANGYGQQLRGEVLAQELRMTAPMVLAGVIKWCWGRLQSGVVGWDSYELFKVGESDSNMAPDSFTTFIPLSVDNDARSRIIFDFFDLLSAVAAHGKMNGFGGRKLSRLAAWWAFEHVDTNNGFEGGYKAWLAAADATSHLFFAYLRSLAPQPSQSGILMLPRSLEKLLAETEYPPQRPALMQTSTNKVVMIVDQVSPTPFALLRRARHFQYREEDKALREWSDYEDPVQALTEECRRVLRAIAAANQSQAVSSAKHSTGLCDASWSRFEDIGFGSTLEEDDVFEFLNETSRRGLGLRTAPASFHDRGRPTTPSWADFLSSGFVNEPASPTRLFLPPDKALPPIETKIRQRSSQSHRPRLESDRDLEPGELASITRFDLDDAFWWVWMSSLAPEETAERKSAFGRCAVVEIALRCGRWLVMEEMVNGAAPAPEAGAYIAEKKGFFSWARRNKEKAVSRSRSTGKQDVGKNGGGLKTSSTTGVRFSKTSIGSDQQAKIQAAAHQLQAQQMLNQRPLPPRQRRGRTDAEVMAEKTNSILTLQTAIVKEASPAVKWASKYDREATREAYLANAFAGRGLATASMGTNGQMTAYEASLNSSSTVPAPAGLDSGNGPANPAALAGKSRQVPVNPCSAERRSDAGRGSPVLTSTRGPDSVEVARENVMSPELDPSCQSNKMAKKLHKEAKKGKGGSFKKLFGRNKNKQSKTSDTAGMQLKAMSVTDEEVAAPAPVPGQVVDFHHYEEDALQDALPVPSEEAVAKVSPPESAVEPTLDMPEPDEASYVGLADATEADKEFSRFDQGPLLDQPACVSGDEDGSEDQDEVATPPSIARHPSSSAQPRVESDSTDTTPKSPAVHDRWAQIRKNAAERAIQRQEEEKKHEKCDKTTKGDDENGGEETIESRVARIKARVAKLTANSQADGPASAVRSPPVRR